MYLVGLTFETLSLSNVKTSPRHHTREPSVITPPFSMSHVLHTPLAESLSEGVVASTVHLDLLGSRCAGSACGQYSGRIESRDGFGLPEVVDPGLQPLRFGPLCD
jgi:hypothetical protein